jgi:cbb3-type cytochrome c oxidase subunit III
MTAPLRWRRVESMKRRKLGVEAASALVVMLALGLAGAALIFGFFFGRDTKHTSTVAPLAAAAAVDPHIAAGAHDFVQFGCARCHGLQGKGGVSQYVPALANVGTTITPATLRSIIDHGLGESKNPVRPYMPVWGAVISNTQVSDLVSYIRAGLPEVATAVAPAIPTNQGFAVEGAQLYVADGCINCHGPNGLGGVPNPRSPDKTIPPLTGQDFHDQFNTDAKIIDVIRTGSVIGRAPIVSMPHWGGIITPQQLSALAAYIKTLK